MSITDTIGNVLDDNAPIGAKEALHNPFMASPIFFTKSSQWVADPGQTVVDIPGDGKTVKLTITTPMTLIDIFTRLVGSAPTWMADKNLNFLAKMNTKLVHQSNSAYDVYSVTSAYLPLAENVAIGAGVGVGEFVMLEVYDYKIVTV